MRRPSSRGGRYGIAVVAVAVALLVKLSLAPFIVGESAFLLLSVAVLVAAVFGGFGPGLLATLLGGLAAEYFLLSPVGTLVPPSASHVLRGVLFLIQGLAISAIGARLAHAQRRTEEDRERVRVSEGRLAEAQKIAHIGNWDYEVATDEAYWSDELYRIFGFAPQEFVPDYKTFLRLVHPEDRKILQEAIRGAARGSDRSSVEYRIVRPDGEVRAVSTRYEPVADGSGRLVRLVGTIQDVTERRRAEEALGESEERYRVVAETASDAIIVIDEAGSISFVNEAAGGTFGYAPEEMLGEPLTMLMPERLRELHRSSLRRHVLTGERRLDWRSVEFPGLHRSGRELSLELSFGEFVRDGKRFFTGFVRDVTERVRAEEALRESEGRFRAVVEQAADGILLVDVHGKHILESNVSYQSMLGYAPEELSRLTLYDVVPYSREEMDCYVRRVQERGRYVSGRRRHRRKDGSLVEVEVSASTVFYAESEAVCIVVRDITERLRFEEELQISEERFRSIIEQSPLSVQILSPDGRTLRVNRAWEELWGATLEEISAAGYNILRDRQLVDKGVMPYIERGFAGEAVRIPPIVYDPDQSLPEVGTNEEPQRWVSAYIYPVRDEAGNIREVTLVHEDITERVRAEGALRESEGRFRSTFEQAAVGMAHVGLGGEWLRVNEKLCEIVGYAREELLGLTFQGITHPEDLRRDEEAFRRLLLGEMDTYSTEKRYVRKDGSSVWINLTTALSREVSGEQRYFISVIEDITDRKRYEQELVRLASYPLLNPNPLVEVGSGGTPTYLNPAAEALFPELPEAGASHPLLEGVEALDRELGEGSDACEIRVGERFYYRVISRVPQGGLLRIYATDITERRRAEDALRRSEERFRSLIQYGSDIIAILDAEGNILYESPAVERIMGYLPEERVGRNVFEIIHPEDSEALVGVLAEFAGEEAPHPITVEYRARARDGSWRYFEAIGVNLLRNPSIGGIVVNSRDITERRRAEEELRQSEERYRTLFESMEQGFCVIEVLLDEHGEPEDYRFLEVNPAFEYQTGLVGAEGRKALELVPDLEQHWIRLYGDVALSGAPASFENVSEAMGRWFDVYAFRVGGEGSRRVAILFSDVTERRRSEEELRRSEARYRAVIEQMAEGIFMFDPETKRFMETNTAFERMFGYTAREVRNMTIYELVAHAAGNVDAYVRRCLEERHVFVGERRYRCKDGSLLDVEVSGSVIAYGEGREVICAVVRDMTERRRAEEALRQSEALYRAVVEQATENIFLVDAETRQLLESNAALCESLGYTQEDLSEMTLYDLVAADRESVDLNIRRVLELGSYSIGEREYRRKDGTTISVEVGASVIHREGRPTLCVVAHDIEDRKHKEEALREVRQAERSRIARELHDNALQDIIYALQEAQILEEISEGEYATGEISEALRRSVEGLRAAIFELRLEETLRESFVASMKNAVDLHRRMARRSHGIELEVAGDFPRELHQETGRAIVRIVQEALSNARRHSEARLVTVSLRVEGGNALVEVADDGRGFDAETSEDGLGTYSARQRAREIGGELEVESAPGRGTLVRLKVPIESLVEKRASRTPDG